VENVFCKLINGIRKLRRTRGRARVRFPGESLHDSPENCWLTVLLATRAASKPNSECGNWQLAAKKATRTAATFATSTSTATFGRQKKISYNRLYTYIFALSLWPHIDLSFFVLFACECVFAKCNSAAAAVNMLLVCFCGFVAHHKSENPPHSFVALAFVSLSYCIREFGQYLYLCVGLHVFRQRITTQP